MKRIRKVLYDKSGLAAPLACAVVIILIIIMTGITEYLRLQIIAAGVRDALQTSVTSVAAENYKNVFSGLREGYAGGYELSASDVWSINTDTGDVYDCLDDTLGLNCIGANHIKITNGKTEYRLYGLNVTIINVPFAPDNPDNEYRFSADVKIGIDVPVYFTGTELYTMKITLNVKAGYIPKFG